MSIPDTVPWWVPFVWPAFTGVFNVVLRTRTPEEWVARGERYPRFAAVTRLMRAVGWDPVKMVQALGELTSGAK